MGGICPEGDACRKEFALVEAVDVCEGTLNPYKNESGKNLNMVIAIFEVVVLI